MSVCLSHYDKFAPADLSSKKLERELNHDFPSNHLDFGQEDTETQH